MEIYGKIMGLPNGSRANRLAAPILEGIFNRTYEAQHVLLSHQSHLSEFLFISCCFDNVLRYD